MKIDLFFFSKFIFPANFIILQGRGTKHLIKSRQAHPYIFPNQIHTCIAFSPLSGGSFYTGINDGYFNDGLF